MLKLVDPCDERSYETTMKLAFLCIMGILAAPAALAVDYMEPNKRFASPDKHWEVWVGRPADEVKFFISAAGSPDHQLLGKNGRHFGVEWSPDSKTVLVYDNFGSGSSDTIVFRQTKGEWKQIYRTEGGFHVIWRLDKWLPKGVGVLLRSNAGGSSPDKVPPTVTVKFDAPAPIKKAP